MVFYVFMFVEVERMLIYTIQKIAIEHLSGINLNKFPCVFFVSSVYSKHSKHQNIKNDGIFIVRKIASGLSG